MPALDDGLGRLSRWWNSSSIQRFHIRNIQRKSVNSSALLQDNAQANKASTTEVYQGSDSNSKMSAKPWTPEGKCGTASHRQHELEVRMDCSPSINNNEDQPLKNGCCCERAIWGLTEYLFWFLCTFFCSDFLCFIRFHVFFHFR